MLVIKTPPFYSSLSYPQFSQSHIMRSIISILILLALTTLVRGCVHTYKCTPPGNRKNFCRKFNEKCGQVSGGYANTLCGNWGETEVIVYCIVENPKKPCGVKKNWTLVVADDLHCKPNK
ncbi:hypothetical protein BC937DRAFT_87108 [Endogone sp. FLAS-F59071]|nr:hypothetical protein BC937DRAFT_87108 [Endogone sp. FLAS-F59071]|eukprot:RUS12750.1 hypothetical protein BC937DRAFT_87108 [Endogone sp. FLAS-F59071]